jgi:hypothetical protein
VERGTSSRLLELTREQLFEKVWSIPGSTLAAEFGISDVALAKTCKRLGVPRPPRGYWARLAAGQKVRKPALPPQPAGRPNTVTFNLQANEERRKEWSRTFPAKSSELAQERKSIELIENESELHHSAQRILHLMEKTRPDPGGRVLIHDKNVPEIHASLAQAKRIASAVDAIIRTLALAGIQATPGDETSSLRFSKGDDYLPLRIEEEVDEVELPPTQEQKRRPSWTWQNRVNQLSGKLTFRLGSNQSLRGRQWNETAARSLELVLLIVIEQMEGWFEKFEQDRIAEAERQKEREENERRWREAERLRNHEDALERVREERARNIIRAAEWWRIHAEITAFIDECERRWKANGQSKLTASQCAWLSWARTQAEKVSPFAAGYPDATKDGDLDSTAIPLGGPYPEVQSLPDPPSMQDLQTSDHSFRSHYQPKDPYPFWLKYQGR